MKRIKRFNEKLEQEVEKINISQEDRDLLTNLLNFYSRKFGDVEGPEKFVLQAKEMVGEGDILQTTLDEFCREKELDKETLDFDPKTLKLKKTKPATKARRKKKDTDAGSGYSGDWCSRGGGNTRSGC